jgi:hypothetical protein
VVSAIPPLNDELYTCTDCAIDYAAVSVSEALDAIRRVPREVASTTSSVHDANLRQRPDATTWSVLEYLCHLRDVYAVYTIRLYRTRCEDRPVLEPMLNDLRVVRFRYNDRAVAPILAELTDNSAGLIDEAAKFSDEEWDRMATRLPGEERSARWMVRQAMHEGKHHARDIAAVARRTTSAGS